MNYEPALQYLHHTIIYNCCLQSMVNNIVHGERMAVQCQEEGCIGLYNKDYWEVTEVGKVH